MTKKKRYKRYSPEFKREALKRASEEGATDTVVCEELDISARQLRRWRYASVTQRRRATTTALHREARWLKTRIHGCPPTRSKFTAGLSGFPGLRL